MGNELKGPRIGIKERSCQAVSIVLVIQGLKSRCGTSALTTWARNLKLHSYALADHASNVRKRNPQSMRIACQHRLDSMPGDLGEIRVI